MNGVQRNKAQNIEKKFPGCLGRMVNLFDLSNGVTGNRLIADKPCYSASSISRSHSDLSRMLNAPFGDQIEDKMIVSELRRSSSNKKSSRMPIKMLIAQEMSRDVERRNNSPNVVAKLMGLETLPRQRPNSTAERSRSKDYSRRSLSHSDISVECWERDDNFVDKKMESDDQNEYIDVYEIHQQSQNTNARDNSLLKERQVANQRKMDLVRQKFMEAKCLAMDEKGRQSKEFQDALEVLSSNRDLFLSFLEEPNSMFSPNLYDMQSAPTETKCITVLRPSKMIDADKHSGSGKTDDKQSKKAAPNTQRNVWEKDNSGCSPIYSNQRTEESPAQPTRIVVLKPSPGRTHEVKALASPPSASPRTSQSEEFYDDPVEDKAQELDEHENLMAHRRDETLLASVFSNGYVGDNSSFHKSENDYAVGNLSDSETASPSSRQSWDYVQRFGSPYSCSSFSRASCSPESSVCREAKRRLSERWAMMAATGSSQDQKNGRRSLGEMLSLLDTKKSVRSDIESTNKELEQMGSCSNSTDNLNKKKVVADSPTSFTRSRSVPVSATLCSSVLSIEVSGSEAAKTEFSKELRKAKSAKSSLRGKVSSLFFSKSKKPNDEKYGVSLSSDEKYGTSSDTPWPRTLPSPGNICDDASEYLNHSSLGDCASPSLHGELSKITCLDLVGIAAEQGIVSEQGALSVPKAALPGNMGASQDQPSPVSVLEPPFEDDDNTIPELSANSRINCQGAKVGPKSHLIDKSPPIESISRTLSWDDSSVMIDAQLSLKGSSVSTSPGEEEQDWPVFIQTLLLAAGIDANLKLDSSSLRWHLPERVLDPELRNKYTNVDDKELLQEAKRRQRRSNRKLVFDCVNAALTEITSCSFTGNTTGTLCTESNNKLKQETAAKLVEHVWGQMREWLYGEVSCGSEENGDGTRMVVERVVGKEVVGREWRENMRVEIDILGKEMEDELVAELVEDAVVDLTSLSCI